MTGYLAAIVGIDVLALAVTVIIARAIFPTSAWKRVGNGTVAKLGPITRAVTETALVLRMARSIWLELALFDVLVVLVLLRRHLSGATLLVGLLVLAVVVTATWCAGWVLATVDLRGAVTVLRARGTVTEARRTALDQVLIRGPFEVLHGRHLVRRLIGGAFAVEWIGEFGGLPRVMRARKTPSGWTFRVQPPHGKSALHLTSYAANKQPHARDLERVMRCRPGGLRVDMDPRRADRCDLTFAFRDPFGADTAPAGSPLG